jgi:superfamily II DNA or RNA helicase
MKPGDEVRLIGDPGRRGTFTGRERLAGHRKYVQVRFPDRTDYVPFDQVELVPEGGESPIDLLQRGRLGRPSDLYRTLAHIRLSGRLVNYIYSLDTTETDFYAYQFKPVLKLLHSVGSGILIADEVGLGKTIEAGLIWTELRSRFDFQRLVVLCPAMLREKWRDELRRRFGMEPRVCGASETVDAIRSIVRGENPEFCLVASTQGMRPPKEWEESVAEGSPTVQLARLLADHAEEDPLIDLLIIDEAHYLRNPETQTAELGRLLRRVSAYAVLLSATPVHLRSEDLFSLLMLVDEDTFSRRDVFAQILEANQYLIRARDQVAAGRLAVSELRRDLERAAAHPLLRSNRQLQRVIEGLHDGDDLQDPRRRAELAYRLDSMNLLGHAVTRTRKRDVKEWRVLRLPVTERVEMTEMEQRFYQTVTDTVRDFCARRGGHEGFLLVTPQRQMSSCMAAALRHWAGEQQDEAEQVYEDFGVELEETGPEYRPLVSELCRRAAELGTLAGLEEHDSKYERLRDRLQAFLTENPREKVVLFSYFRATLQYLRRRLQRDGITCALLMGGADDKEEVLREFREQEGLTVLLSSEVGSEGIDLQFCWVVINYDLPWNPMKVEQRIGRLDRLGQQNPTIRIWNLVYGNTIDDRIYQRLFLRLDIFKRALGELEPILGPQIQRLTQDLLSRRLTPEEEAERIEQTRLALENINQEEERLEGEAASLVAYGDYILSQVQAARDLSRRITVEDIQRHVTEFFARFYPGCQFQQDDRDASLFKVTLSAEAKNDFSAFMRNRRTNVRTYLTRNDPVPVRCRFENRTRMAGRGREEIINQFHPLLRFIAEAIEKRHAVEYPAVAARVRVTELPVALAPGDYRFAITRWSVKALRVAEQLWYGMESIATPGLTVGEQEAEQVLLAVARAGTDWPNAVAEFDLTAEADHIWRLLDDSRSRYDAYIEDVAAQNSDRADLQKQTLENHLASQELKYREIRARHIARNNPGLARAAERSLEKLRARVEREILRIEQNRKLSHSFEQVCVGVMRVDPA